MEIEMKRCYDANVWHKKGDEFYYHCENGPAVIYHDNTLKVEFWYYNKNYIHPERMPLSLFLAYCMHI